jgi:hypothetical protein
MIDEPKTPGTQNSDENPGQDGDAISRGERRRRPRRRVRRATPAPPDPRGPLVLLVVAALAVGIAGVGAVWPTPAETAVQPPVIEPVDTSTLVCPEPGGADGANVRTGVMIVPDIAGQDRSGAASVTYLGAPERPVDATSLTPGAGLNAPGAAVQIDADAGRTRPLFIQSEGGLAPGLVAGTYDLGLSGPRRGLAMMACPPPSPRWWFAGGGSTAGRTSILYLVNPESSDAEVDVRIAGPDGIVNTPSVRGLVVPALSRVAVNLSRVAPRLPAAVWQVQVRTGRVVAALQDLDSEGLVQLGIDWVPPAAEPATRVIIPGVLGGQGGRQLIIFAPGDTDAEVQVRILAEDGAFSPTEESTVEVTAGTVATVNLAGALNGAPATIELLSDQPVVAGIRQRHPGVDATVQDNRTEISYSAGAQRISVLGAAATLPAVRGTQVNLWITLPRPEGSAADESGATDDTGSSVTVRVLPFGEGVQAPDPVVVTVPYDRAVAVPLERPENATWFTVVVQPSDKPVYVAQTSLRRGQRGSLISGYPLTPMRTSVSLPSARQSLPLSLPLAP